MFNTHRLILSTVTFLCLAPGICLPATDDTTPEENPVSADSQDDVTSEQQEKKTRFKFLSKKPENLLIVPIPTSGPTFGTGLILGGAYFYPQTEQQKSAQPASFTGAAAGYTDNESWVAGAMQQNYWQEDKWRFTGAAGYLDLKLELTPSAEEEGDEIPVDWLVDGSFVQTKLSRRLRGKWYLGVTARYLDISQAIDLNIEDDDFNLSSEIRAAGIGLNLDFDSRDEPSNPYRGRFFELKAMTNNQSGSNSDPYQSYNARFRSYHGLADPLVFAWDVGACMKSGRVPLWDTCRLPLRGFSATDYQGKQSIYAQAEIRWRFYKRWGIVAFAGAGRIDDSFGQSGEDETIPSYGLGIRFMVLESQRINLRLDYARSDNDNDAWYVSVTEAF